MKHTLATITIAASALAYAPAYATGIPVIDAAGLANAVQQFTQLKQTYDQTKAQYEQFRGNRGMGSLLGKPELRNALPPEWRPIYVKASNGEYQGLSDTGKAIRDVNKVLDDAELSNMPAGQAQRIKQDRDAAAMYQAVPQDAYKAAGERISRIQQMVNRIDSTSDPKAVMDLQAAIQAEQAMLQNEQIRLQLLAQLRDAEDRLQAQQSRERFARTSGPSTVRVRCPVGAC